MKHDSKQYFWVTVLNVIITVTEFIGGAASGSLALLSDAIHNLTDVFSIVLAFVANLFSKKRKNYSKTFGYQRAETLAAYTNGLLLLVISIYLFIEAIGRFSKPEPIKGEMMFIISLVGLAGNLISMLILKAGSKNNLNARALFLNMMSDTLSSVAVVLGSLVIYYWNLTWVDPVLTILAAILMLKEAFEVTRDSADVLMETNPDIDLDKVKKSIMTVQGVTSLHHVHVWRYSDDIIMLDAHMNVDSNLNAMQIEKIDQEIADLLKKQFGINHVTLQAECQKGKEEGIISVDGKE